MTAYVILTLDGSGEMPMSVVADVFTSGAAELVVLTEPDPDLGLVAEMIAALGEDDGLACFRPVSEAVKVVKDGFVEHGLDRRLLMTLDPPYVIRLEAMVGLRPTSVSDLLALLIDRGRVGLFPHPET